MAMKTRERIAASAALAFAISLAIAGCTTGGSPEETSAPAGDVLGTPNPASGDPVVFGVLNLESGPVTFPEVLQAEQAAVDYVNEYLGGIGGHPIKLVSCVTDGQPSTSARCASQLLDENPVAIIGAADTGSPGAIEVWRGAGMPYLGGIPFTPVESNYENAVIFSSASVGDSAMSSVYAAQTLGAKSAVVIYTGDTQGTSIAQGTIIPTMKAAGVETVTEVSIPPTSSDVTAAVATAIGANPDAIFLITPAACPAVMSSLKQLGNTAALFGIDPCTSPPAIAGANGGAEGLYFSSPVLDPSANTPETQLYLAALAKYAPADMTVDSLAAIGFETIINVQAALADFTPEELTPDAILAAFRSGTDVPNFLGHPYTCDGNQLRGASAICNAYQEVRQITDGKPVVVSDGWVSAGEFYPGPGPAPQ